MSGLILRIQKKGMFHTNMINLSKSFPDSSYGIFAKGYLNLNQSKYEDCIADFEKAIKNNSNDIYLSRESFFYKGICNFDISKYDEAIEDFTKVLEFKEGQEPSETYINALLERSKVYNRIKKYDLAKEGISEVIESLKKNKKLIQYYDYEQYHVDRISLNYTLKNYAAALEDCDWLIKESKDKKDLGYFYRGQFKYKLLDDPEGGYEDYLKAAQTNPKNFAALATIVEVLNKKGEYKKIPSYLTLAIKVKPQLGVLYYARGYFYAQLGDRVNSCKDMRESLKYSSEDVERDSEGYYSMDHLPGANSFINVNCR
ncbi:hypothetical protein CH365_12995 [Leptospira neocaledonica]|uniref:Uncharacterized protein n=2 Tax=Leptospira neocaledonica TaxID=2023192 RepID=A0A2M9ZWA3_9LEPT|nr:hypothetical protein CH365_12995 [Leptospira neocaledonica]